MVPGVLQKKEKKENNIIGVIVLLGPVQNVIKVKNNLGSSSAKTGTGLPMA